MAADIPMTPAGARPGAGELTPRPPTGARAWHAVRWGARSLARATGEAFGTLAAGLDLLLAGLVIGFIVAAAANGPAMFLGIPWPLEVLVSGGGAALVALAGALAGIAIAGSVRLLGRGLGWALVHVPNLRRTPAPIRLVVALPFRFVAGLPAGWLGAFAAAIGLGIAAGDGGILGLFLPAKALTPYIFLTGITFALVGAATHIVRPALRQPGRVRRGVAVILMTAAVATTGGGTALLLSPGSTATLVRANALLDGTAAAMIPAGIDDPGLPGTYEVRALSYGSGTEARRPAFGRDALVTTPCIDASKVLGKLDFGADDARTWFWGFGTDALPLNGLVWMPVGAGPFPLVLVVHGNHAMGDFSEFGYEYLGRHLASRGFITVSVDEDFLNGSWADDWQGQEQVVRAWLLLLHLDQWRAWNQQPASPFHGMVDMDRVALMGHSRGGEAASVAAMLAARTTAPGASLAPWPSGLRVRAVVGIAPSDGQYSSPVVLKDVDLLELQGGHDSDVRGWIGIQQYARTIVSGDAFKAAFWAYRANHGQFSTVWGRSDWGPSGGAQLNLAPLLEPVDQQDVAKTAIGAFLEASLHDRAGYRGLFQRPMVGREWLPDDIYLVRSTDGAVTPLTLADPSKPADGLTVRTDGFSSDRAMALPLRALQPNQGVRGVRLEWAGVGGQAAWTLDGLTQRIAALEGPELHLSLANGADPSSGAGVPEVRIELTTTDGVSVSIPLSRWGALPPPLETQLSKSPVLDALAGLDLSVTQPVERVLQGYVIPVAEFAAENPAFRTDRVASLRVLVDRSAAGVLWLAEVGLSGG